VLLNRSIHRRTRHRRILKAWQLQQQLLLGLHREVLHNLGKLLDSKEYQT
jgi:hypothetical protein